MAALVLCGGCARANPAYNVDEGDDTVNVSGEDTTEGPSTGSSSTGSIDPSVATSGVSVSGDASTTTTVGGSETSVGRSDLPRFVCEAGPECDAFEGRCAGERTCRPYVEQDELARTRCVPNGTALAGEECLPSCAAGPETACGSGLVCDRTGLKEGVCRFLCKGTVDEPICDEGGICFREITDGGSIFGTCEGECSPFEEGSCGADACVMGLDEPVPVCVEHTGQIPVEGCADDPCPQGWGCIPPELSNDCSAGPCCFPLCEPFPLGVQCAEGTCVSFEELGGPNVPVGFCNPP